MALAPLGTYTAAAAPKVSTPGPYNTLYGLANPGTTVPAATNPYTSVLSGAVGYGLLNPGTTTASPAKTGPVPKLSAPAGTFTLPDGSTVNYTTMLKNDPLLQQQLAQIQAANAADQASLNAGEQQALIGYGQVPANVATIPGLSGVLDQTTQDLAKQNTAAGLSTYAKLQNAYQQSVQGTDNSLAARGLLRSGAFGQDNAQDLLGYNQAQDTAVQQLNQYLSGLYNGYLGQQQALQQQEYGAYETALQNLIAEISAGLIGGGGGPAGPGSATPPPAASGGYDPSSGTYTTSEGVPIPPTVKYGGLTGPAIGAFK